MANILISGGAGFIGSHLALKLLKKGHQITVLDNLFSSNTLKCKSIRVIQIYKR